MNELTDNCFNVLTTSTLLKQPKNEKRIPAALCKHRSNCEWSMRSHQFQYIFLYIRFIY